MQKRFVKAGMFRNSIAMLAVLSVFAACSGLLQDTDNSETAPTAQEAQAIEKHGAVIRIPLTTASASRAVITGTLPDGTIDLGLGKTAAEGTADYFEAYLKDTGPGTTMYFGSAQAGVDYLIIGCTPGTYKVLVLAGTGANGDPVTGEKVLLGVGYVATTTVTAGIVNEVHVPMTALQFYTTINGVPKSATAAPAAAQAVLLNGTYDDVANSILPGLVYAQFAKNVGTPLMWSNVLEMKVTVKIKHLEAIGNWMGGTLPKYPDPNVRARIRTLNTQYYAMEPLVFSNPPTPTMPSIINTGDTNFEFTLPSAKIPTYDAAGGFFFNIVLPDPTVQAGTTPSSWNIRNRLLWSTEGYYGGGIAFLFGNAGTEWVKVIPDPWS
jgi:hypothetical protein